MRFFREVYPQYTIDAGLPETLSMAYDGGESVISVSMNIQKIGVGALAVCAVVLAGCSRSAEPSGDQAQGPAQGAGQVQTQGQATGSAADWVAALASGKKMQCEYSMGTDADKKYSVKMFAEKGRYRTETVMSAGMMVSILDGKTMYTWVDGTKQGMKMDLECAKSLKDQLPQAGPAGKAEQQSYDTPEQAIGNIPNITCAEASGEVDLSVPSDVTFTDQCEMLKSTLGKMKDMQGKLPDSVKGALPQ